MPDRRFRASDRWTGRGLGVIPIELPDVVKPFGRAFI